jgi:uncharacterized protein YPO0396
VTHDQAALPAFEKNPADQFRLRRFQLFNWGTFCGVFDIEVAAEGYLFVGPSGSGKSTLLDANAALLTPPKWVDFNVAARDERGGRDRSYLSYVRGAWADQTDASGEVTVRYLREDTTWSAIAQQFRDGHGRVVTLVHVLWVRGKTTANTEVRHLYLVFKREFDIRELEFFQECDFDVRRLKAVLHDALVRDEFTPFQECFRAALGIDSSRALRLLHKTQSAKNMGELNAFLRDYMLDEPETFALADKLVEQFGELNDAWRAVRDARLQIETLEPARVAHDELERVRTAQNELKELSANLERHREQQRSQLLENAIALARIQLETDETTLQLCRERTDEARARLNDAMARRADAGGGRLEHLAAQLRAAEQERDARQGRREAARGWCREMEWTAPDTPGGFAELRAAAARQLERADADDATRQGQRDALRDALVVEEREFAQLRRDIEAMQRRTSNIPATLLEMREALAQALQVHESELPFVGELIEVKPEEGAWQGPIERVLHGFARSLLVPEALYRSFSDRVNEQDLRGRLVYHRMLARASTSQPVAANALYRKLNFATTDAANWVREELKERFDYRCTPQMSEFRAADKAVTLTGQVKHGPSRHEKDDRAQANDPRHWVLGLDNAAKLALYQQRASECAQKVSAGQRALREFDEQSKQVKEVVRACTLLHNLRWDEIDVTSSLQRVESLQRELLTEKAARPQLAELDAQVQHLGQTLESAQGALGEQLGVLKATRDALERHRQALGEVPAELLTVALTPFARQGLQQRFALYGEPTLNTLDAMCVKVQRSLHAEEAELARKAGELASAVIVQFNDFIHRWAAEAQGLDATLHSAADFFAKLQRLKDDGLPQYEARFLRLLHDANDQNLTRLSTRLEEERKNIRERTEMVNLGLKTTAYNPGTHLSLETRERQLAEVLEFKQTLRRALSHSLSDDPEEAQRRFALVHALVKRFASQDPVDVKWRQLVLDVRMHVEFVARELRDDDATEVQVWRSGAGKSGGQRQKLAATCLAAALSYQLGGRDHALPQFCTVVMDEAFDKSDSDFTRVAMNVFKTFGFQMIVATPLKSVMTLEPYIGGACFVHNADLKSSRIIEIAYDHEAGRLRFSSEQARHVEEAAAA